MNSANILDDSLLTLQAKLDQIETRVRAQLGGRVLDLSLLVHQHGLILRGLARTYYAKQLAQHAVMRAIDLPILANEIEVS